MIYGILSDIHGNLEAFYAALQRLKEEGAQQYIFCGDLVGYGPDPEKCIQKYRNMQDDGKVVGVLGNHDAVFSHPELREFFNFDALQALGWTGKQLNARDTRFVSFLPEVTHGDNFTVVHGTPMDPIKEYFSSCQQYRMAYKQWQGQMLFVGHTHLSFYMEGDASACHVHVVREEEEVPLQPSCRYVINAGSIGKPRDNDARASFGLWDTEKETFRFLRQKYDFHLTQEKMRAAKLPEFLIDSLSWGM